MYTTWIIDFFKRMVHLDELRLGDKLQMECAWFAFSQLLQNELDKMRKEWNTHRIRSSRYIQKSVGYLMKCSIFLNHMVSLITDGAIAHIINERDIHKEAEELLGTCDRFSELL